MREAAGDKRIQGPVTRWAWLSKAGCWRDPRWGGCTFVRWRAPAGRSAAAAGAGLAEVAAAGESGDPGAAAGEG